MEISIVLRASPSGSYDTVILAAAILNFKTVRQKKNKKKKKKQQVTSKKWVGRQQNLWSDF